MLYFACVMFGACIGLMLVALCQAAKNKEDD